MTTEILEKTETPNTYDETPYHSFPYSQSRPDYLRTLGALFGMNPPAVETARVLELGCAEGWNLIPHAAKYPKAKFVGVDLSKVQIDAGQEHIKKMGLKNIELKHMSITDVDKKFGEFDYIICHGVISWVPDFVRDKIFDICSQNLSANGIAYISYNTLPGWNMVRNIRDMMLYHSKDFSDPREKIAQSRLLLKFVADTLENSDTPYAKFLKQETELLANQNDHYLRHDHLEEENKQFYFNEFMAEAGKRGLQYLSDTSLSSMYIGNMPKNVAEKLQEVNDIVRSEQYMDFITNRRFRSTLLCHRNVPLNRNLNNNHAEKFSMSMNIQPETPLKDIDIESSEPIKFFFDNNKENTISTNSPELKAILYSFAENIYNPLSFNSFVKAASAKLKGNRMDKIKQEMLNNIMMLAIKGYLNLSQEEGTKSKASLDKPQLWPTALYQATNRAEYWVTNLRHMPISINIFDKIAAKYMDGKNSKEQIIDALVQDVKEGKLSVKRDEKPVTDEAILKQDLSLYLENTIERFAHSALLV